MRKELMDKLKRGGMPGAPNPTPGSMDDAFQHPDSKLSLADSGSNSKEEEEGDGEEGEATTPFHVGGSYLKPKRKPAFKA